MPFAVQFLSVLCSWSAAVRLSRPYRSPYCFKPLTFLFRAVPLSAGSQPPYNSISRSRPQASPFRSVPCVVRSVLSRAASKKWRLQDSTQTSLLVAFGFPVRAAQRRWPAAVPCRKPLSADNLSVTYAVPFRVQNRIWPPTTRFKREIDSGNIIISHLLLPN